MALWSVNLQRWMAQNFKKKIAPETVLVEYNGLLTFTFRDASENLMLAHLSDEDKSTSRYIVAPTTEREVEKLTKGTISLRGALNQPLIWLLDVRNGEVAESWCGTLARLPEDAGPRPDAMLHPSLEPLIKMRIPDVRYRLGAVATEAIRYIVEGAETALKGLLEYVKPNSSTEEYQLEAQQLAFNSIEIAFQPTRRRPDKPVAEAFDAPIVQVEGLLSEGFKWVSAHGNYSLPQNDERVILGAIRALSPSRKQQTVLKVEVSGKALRQNPEPVVALTLDTHRQISDRIRAERKPTTISPIGRVREMDEDARTFELRDMPGRPNEHTTFVFGPEQHEDVYAHLGRPTFVQATGEREMNRYRLIDLMDVPPPENS